MHVRSRAPYRDLQSCSFLRAVLVCCSATHPQPKEQHQHIHICGRLQRAPDVPDPGTKFNFASFGNILGPPRPAKSTSSHERLEIICKQRDLYVMRAAIGAANIWLERRRPFVLPRRARQEDCSLRRTLLTPDPHAGLLAGEAPSQQLPQR